MSKARFFQQVRNYYPVTAASEQAWADLLEEKKVLQG